MSLIKKPILFVILTCLILPFLSAQPQPEPYKKWLEEEVVYIITPTERDVFRKLTTDRQREGFIEAFWKQRDPTPGTPRNEFKDEHYRRLAYANEFYGRGTPRPGWMTDRGRIYIILGPPRNIETFDTIMSVHPAEIWFYSGDTSYGLPPAFNVIFFKKEGMGEYILFSPVNDGPRALIAEDLGESARDDRETYQRLVNLAPVLAPQTLSLIPGERVMPGSTSLASTRLLATVFSYPQKKVEDTYAQALLKYKDIIEVDYSANYIGSDYLVNIAKAEPGYFFLQYSVEPKKISVDSYGDRYSTNFELDGRISDAQGNTIFQYTKEIGLNFTAGQLKDLGETSMAIQDMVPLVPGAFRFDLLVKNTISKEFTSLEENITVPGENAALFLSPLLLGYKLEAGADESGDFVPFKTAQGQLLCPARKTFTPKETLYVFFQAFGLTPEVRSRGQLAVSFLRKEAPFLTKTRGIIEFRGGQDILLEFPLAAFPPDYYKVKVSVRDESRKEILSGDEDFEVTTAADIPRPLIISKVMPSSRADEYDYILGIQELNLGRNDEAYALLERAYRKNPNQLQYALGLSQTLYVRKEYQKVKDILAPFRGESATDQVVYYLGKSCHALSQYGEAAAHYTDYLSRFGLNLEILNLLGMAHYRLGNFSQALDAWKKSLDVNSGQEEVQRLFKSLQEEMKKK